MSGNITSSTLYNVNMASLSGGTAGGAEVAAYDAARKLALVLGANGVDFLNVMTGVRVGGIGKADVGGTGGTPTSLLGTANSVAIHGDKMAVAFDGASAGVNGYVAMFQMNGTGSAATWLYTVTGPSAATFAVPDMVTFTPDGSKLLVALEGEPASNYSVDPFGGVGVINVVAGTLQIADFTAFDSQKAALKAAGVRLNAPSDGATPVAGAGLVSKDVEPEYITISSDGTKAYVTLQEANSLAVVDLTGTPTVTAILPFGTKDHSLAGNGMDTSDQDGFSGANANIRTVPVKGLYMPDAIASFEQGGKTYLVTANEGDAREYSANTDVVRLNAKTAGAYTIQLDPTVFGANINTVASEASTIRAAADLGRLAVSRTNGDTDGDGDIDVIHSIGARSFSIWTIDGGALTRN
ncbi:MAG: choice-of-anchor I family protein, partial [Roseococcus sp.]